MFRRVISLICLFVLSFCMVFPCSASASDGFPLTGVKMSFKNRSNYADVYRECKAELHGFASYVDLAKSLSPPSGGAEWYYYADKNLLLYPEGWTTSCIEKYNTAFPDTPIEFPLAYVTYNSTVLYCVPCVDSIPVVLDSTVSREYLGYNLDKFDSSIPEENIPDNTFPSDPDPSVPLFPSDSESFLPAVVSDGALLSVFNEILSILPSLVVALIGFISFRKVLIWFGGVLKGM